MARGLNKVLLIGYLGGAPEVKYTADETAVANFNMATNRSVKRGDDWVDETDWHRIVAWKKLAEICQEYLDKGSHVYVEGQLRTRAWEDKDGVKRWTTEVIAREILMLDRREGSKSSDRPPVPPEETVEDDCPF